VAAAHAFDFAAQFKVTTDLGVVQARVEALRKAKGAERARYRLNDQW